MNQIMGWGLAGALVAMLAMGSQVMAEEAPGHGQLGGESVVADDARTGLALLAQADLRARVEGMNHYANQRYKRAMSSFLRAARYADKASQAMIAEMYWQGTGVKQDRALAYAWMDLAAERADPNFLVLREHYWAELGEAARLDAIARGEAIYAKYGDAVAAPRLERALQHEQRALAGVPNEWANAPAGYNFPYETGRISWRYATD